MTTDKPREKKDNRKRAVAIGLVGLGIAGLAAASAATLAVSAGGDSDNVAGGSADVDVMVTGLSAVNAAFTLEGNAPELQWNIPDDERDWALTLNSFNGTPGGELGEAGTFRVALYDAPINDGSGPHEALLTGSVTAAASATEAVVVWAGEDGTTLDAVMPEVESISIVFTADLPVVQG